MKTTSIVLLIALAPLLTYGQINSSFDFVFGIENSFRISNVGEIPNVGIDLNTEEAYGQRSKYEEDKLGWRLGFNYNRPLSESWCFKLGFRLMNGGFKSAQLNDVLWQTEQDGIDGWIEPQLVDVYQKKYNFYFLEIPIGLRYEINDAKFSPYLEYGIAPTVLIASQINEQTNIRKETSEMENLNQLHLVGYLSAGFNYHMNEASTIFFQPIVRYHITTVQENTLYKDNLYNIGVEFGMRKVLK